MNPHQIADLINSLKAAKARNEDAFHIISAVASVPRRRIEQIVAGKGEAITLTEFQLLHMVRL